MRFITTRSQSAQGVPKWNSEKERRKGRKVLFAPQRDLVVILAVGDRGRDNQEQHLPERIHDLGRRARVLDPAEMVQ
jgi:hypothetical protein